MNKITFEIEELKPVGSGRYKLYNIYVHGAEKLPFLKGYELIPFKNCYFIREFSHVEKDTVLNEFIALFNHHKKLFGEYY